MPQAAQEQLDSFDAEYGRIQTFGTPVATICILTNKMHKILVIRLYFSIRCSTYFGLY